MPKNQEIVQAKYEALQQEVLALTNLLQSANAQAMSDQSRLKKEAQTLKLALYQAVLESPKYPAEDVSDPVCGLLDKYEHQIDQLFLSATDCSFYMINLLTKLSQQPKAPKSLTIANDVCRKKVLWLECNADLTRLQIMQETYMQNIEIEVQELNRKIAKIKDYSIIEMLVTNDTLSIKPFAQRAATGDAKYMPGEEWFTNML
ncbi:MAG TPA: hypothetical protein VLG38_01205, partial [Gammaproteobacteria bacterium]|nr:hypothetical protein [Gammaproteobacteria bacterium]